MAARPRDRTAGGKRWSCRRMSPTKTQVKQMFAKVIEEFGSLDVLVNNAGIQKPAPSHEIETSDFDRVIAVNLRGPFLCSREAIRHFLESRRPRRDPEQLERARDHSQAEIPALFDQQGRHGEPDEVAGAGVRRPTAFA